MSNTRAVRFRLSTLLWMMVVCCIAFAWWRDHRALTAPSRTVVAELHGVVVTKAEVDQVASDRANSVLVQELINRKLILAACNELGVTVTVADVDAEEAKMSRKFSIPRDEYYRLLEEDRGFTRERYRRDVLRPTVALRRIQAVDATRYQQLMQDLRSSKEVAAK